MKHLQVLRPVEEAVQLFVTELQQRKADGAGDKNLVSDRKGESVC